MFELDQSLQEWTKRFGPTAAMRNCDIEELAQHVRDSVAALKSKGLDDEEAFLVATHRVGPTGAVEEEFAKVNGGHTKAYQLFWMISGVMLFEVCRLCIAAVTNLSGVLVASAGGGGSVIGYSSVAITTLLWLGVAIWVYRMSVIASDRRSIDRVLTQPYGKWVGIAAALLFLVSAMTKIGSQIIMAYLTPLADYGQAAAILALANAVLAFLIPMAFLFVILSIRSSLPGKVETAQ